MHRARLLTGPAPALLAVPLALLGAACSHPAPVAPTEAAPDHAAPVAKLREAVLASSRAFDTVQSLTDEAGPRLSGSPAGKVAVAWALDAMRAAGLVKVHAEPCAVPHWERGDEGGEEIVEPSLQPLVLTALGGSVGTPAEGVEADVVEAPSLEGVDALGPSAAGKIVFIDAHMDRTRDGSGYGRAVVARSQGAIHAAKLGAVAVLVRSIGTDESRAPHTGGMRYDEGVAKIPAAALAIPDADVLHRLLSRRRHVRVRLKLGARSLPDAEGANVVGDVEGSATPKEVVLLGAHLDSWDLGRGAIDDGAGCAIVMEAARQIAGLPHRPRRTVRAVLFANEENGLRGARAYAAAHAPELGDHVVAIEADLGAGRVYATRFLGGPEGAPAFHAVAAAVAPLGVTAQDEGAHGGSDLIPLRAAGVPIIDLMQDATSYFDFHHTANDTMERISKADIDQAAAAFAAAAYAAADAPERFGRVPEGARKKD